MNLLFRYLMRNIAEKKGRTALIVLSVMLSSALFLATTGMTTTMNDLFARRLSQYFGNAQVIVHSNRNSPSWLHSLNRLQSGELPFAWAVPSIESGGRIRRSGGEWTDVSLRGFNLEDLDEMAPPVWMSPPPEEFRGNRIIIGEHSADFFGLEVGDPITIQVDDAPMRFTVAAIARSTGLFTDDGRSHTLVVPLEKLAVAFRARGRSAATWIRAAEPAGPEEVAALMAGVQNLYPRYTVRETISQEEISQWTRDTTIPFTIMSFLVFFMSAYIIYTSFRVITLERLPVIGTFRSVGATRKSTAGLLLAESGIYGLLGGVPGILVGLGVLKLLIKGSSNDWMNAVETRLVVTPLQMVMALVVAFSLSVASAAIPIIKASRLPIKDVVLGSVDDRIHNRPWRYIIGGIMIVAGGSAPHFVPESLLMPVGSVSIFIVIIGTSMALPWLVKKLVNAAAVLNRKLFGNVGELAAKNLRDDPSVINNIALLTVGITSIFMIATMSISAAESLTQFFDDARFDAWMWTRNADRSTLAQIRSIPGVTDVTGVLEIWDVEMEGYDKPFSNLQAVDGPEVLEWWDFPVYHRDPESVLMSLNDKRSILVSAKSMRRMDLEVGDSLTFMFGDPARPRNYEVVGSFAYQDDTGGFGLVGLRWLKMDTGMSHYESIWVKAPDSADEVKAAIEEKYRDRPLWIRTMAEVEEGNAEDMKQIFLMLQFFSLLAMVIASVGIVNNYLVSYIERRRVLAVIRSVGMSKAQGAKMLLVEALTGGVLGSVIGLASGMVVASFLPVYMQAFQLAISLVVSPWRVLGLLVLGSVLSLGAQLIPTMKSRRLNIVESLKYE